jgi:DNA relaxase NicK
MNTDYDTLEGQILASMAEEQARSERIARIRLATPLINRPASNRSVETAEYIDGVTVDYLRVTFQSEDEAGLLVFLKSWLGDKWENYDYGRYCYKQSSRCGVIALYSAGVKFGMGVHLEARGQGCRQLEHSGVVGAAGWPSFLREVAAAGGRVGHIDLAYDDTSGALDLTTIQEYVSRRSYVSRSQAFDVHNSHNGRSVRIGSRASQSMLRIYDKRAEQLAKGRECEGEKTRVELSFREEKAATVAGLLVEGGVVPFAAWVRGACDFREVTDKEPCRSPAAPWWDAWLDGVARLAVKGQQIADTALTETWEWLKKSAFPALVTVMLAANWPEETLLNTLAGVVNRLPKHKLHMATAAGGNFRL